MLHVIPILFAALFTITFAFSLGMLIFRSLSLALYKWEERLLAFVVGSACLSAIMFVLCSTRLVYRGVLLVLGLATVAYTLFTRAFRSDRKIFARLGASWRWLFAVSFSAFCAAGFLNALAPEHSPDAMAYHLAEVLKYRQAHGFLRITTDIYANLSQGMELLFLFAFDFGRHSAAALVHFAFWVVLAFLILLYGKRIGKPNAGAAAAIFTAASPIVLFDGSIAYIDVALAAVIFAVFYFVQIWDEIRDPKLLVPIGILCGFAYAIKYTGALALIYALGFVGWKLWRAKEAFFRPVLLIAVLASLSIVPWMAKNWIEVANPVSPLANRLFPNPYVHISFEDGWRSYLKKYDLPSRWAIPVEVTTRGAQLEGFTGPLFLLAPIGLLALRSRQGRQLFIPMLLFGTLYFENIGTRFLVPIIPFLSLTSALAICNLPWLLFALVIAHSIASWPAFCSYYCAPDAFRLASIPVRAALRLQSEDSYLSQFWEFNLVRMIGGVVPPNEAIFANGAAGQSYLPRDVRGGYESASNEMLQDMLWTPVVGRFQPNRVLSFEFLARRVRKLRVVQTARLADAQWSIAELRIYSGDTELRRESHWRLTARPNPWDVQLAFDNTPVTRWRTWQPAEPGMYVEVDFGQLEQVSRVALETSDDSGEAQVRLEGAAANDQWIRLSDTPVRSRRSPDVNLRFEAGRELKARQIRYVLIDPGDPGAEDLHHFPRAWGMTLAGSVGNVRLYRIE